MWIFGYGSLIWKVDFKYSERLAGYIKGYHRRFWQGSEDHRGVPGNPGRVATLVNSSEPDDCVWGYAYYVDSDYLDHLDHREKCGYEKTKVTFYPDDLNQDPFELDIYIGTSNNAHFLGPAAITDLAHQIVMSRGPSGRNIDYLLELAQAVRTHFPHTEDKELFELEEEVLRQAKEHGVPIHVHSTNSQERTTNSQEHTTNSQEHTTNSQELTTNSH